MIKISLRLVRATQEGMVLAQQAVRTYTRYAFYSFRDRKGRQSDSSKTVSLDGPRHSLMYNNVEDFVLSQVCTHIIRDKSMTFLIICSKEFLKISYLFLDCL